MLFNYLKIALRNLWRNKTYALVSCSGLALGVACAILLFLFIRFHLSFDHHHANYANIYRVNSDLYRADGGVSHTPGTPVPIAEALRLDFPEIEAVAPIQYIFSLPISVQEEEGSEVKQINGESILVADSSFSDVFTVNWLMGNPEKALRAYQEIVLSEKMAYALFGDKNAMGQTVTLAGAYDFQVTGIIENMPSSSSIPFNALVTFPPEDADINEHSNWNSIASNTQCYILLPENVSEASIEERLPEINKKYKKGNTAETEFHTLQPLSEIHFDDTYGDFSQRITSRTQLTAIGLIALFLIAIACVNFVNLATAQAMRRGKEVGIRKLLGSYRWQLVSQFMGETLLITIISIVLAFGLLQWMLPVFNNFIEQSLDFQPFEDTILLSFLGGIAVLTTLLAGLYPALLLSGFQPARVLKGKTVDAKIGGISLRRGLVGFQFFIAQVLIVTTLVIVLQTNYLGSASMGFDTEARVTVSIPDNSENSLDALRNRLSENPYITSISFASDPPASGSSSWSDFTLENHEETSNFKVQTKMGDEHYLETYDIKLVAGRNVHPSDTTRELLVNETMVKKLGMVQPEEIIGQRIRFGGNAYIPVVGVVADFHTRSLRSSISPCIIASRQSQYWYAGILIDKNAPVQEVLTSIEESWEATYPEGIFDYSFLDESIANFYREERRMSQILTIFAGIAIFISCLGLYGLASFMAAKRTKEVGIRKVLGASVQQIVMLFSKEFVWLVAIAFVISTPVTWYFMHQWLQDFAYRIDLHIGIFLLAGLASLCIALLTVSYRSLKTATSNPVNSLRSE